MRPQLRIGLNTGAAVVGKVQERADVTVLGDTVNFASRLQALAQPDSIFLSEAAHRLVQGMVEASFAGEHTIRGKSEPQKVYRLDGVRSGATRFDAARSDGDLSRSCWLPWLARLISMLDSQRWGLI